MNFQPNRNQTGPGNYLSTAGIYMGTITVSPEIKTSKRGDCKIRLTLETDGGTAGDDLINSEKMWWKLNVYLAAIDPEGTKIPIKDGEDLDFSKDANFIKFVRTFEGHRIAFALWEETYQKPDGTDGTAWRLQPLNPRRGSVEQLPAKIRAQIQNAKPANPEEPDEIPF